MIRFHEPSASGALAFRRSTAAHPTKCEGITFAFALYHIRRHRQRKGDNGLRPARRLSFLFAAYFAEIIEIFGE
jgi:hypothetical protein